jgi:hypothetical protein
MGLASSGNVLTVQAALNLMPLLWRTGLGCIDNLEKFCWMFSITTRHVTSVLPFINSTRAVAAQVAMLLKNHSYNITYCHRGFSFESALQDALMQFEENAVKNVLIGALMNVASDL